MSSISARIVAAALLLVIAVAAQAGAHAGLISSNPSDQQVISRPPTAFQLTFGEDIDRAAVSVIAPDGIVSKPTRMRPNKATVSGSLDLPRKRGTWTIAFRVVSTDGHPVTSEIHFTTTSGQPVTQVQTPSQEPGFFNLHRAHLIWALIAGAAAIGLIVVPALRSRP